MLNASLKDLLRQHCLLPEYSAPFSHMRFGVLTCESHQDLGIFAYVQPLYSHLCLLSHTCEYLLSYENRCWCDHKYFNISESVKFFKVLISVPKLDRKAWIFPTFFFVKILKFSKKSHICEAQEPHMWLYSLMCVCTVSPYCFCILFGNAVWVRVYPAILPISLMICFRISKYLIQNILSWK